MLTGGIGKMPALRTLIMRCCRGLAVAANVPKWSVNVAHVNTLELFDVRDNAFGSSSLPTLAKHFRCPFKIDSSLRDLTDGGFSAGQLKDCGYEARDLKDVGFSAEQLKDGGFSARELKNCGLNAGQLKNVGLNARKLKDVGFSAGQLKDGYGRVSGCRTVEGGRLHCRTVEGGRLHCTQLTVAGELNVGFSG